MSNKAQLKKIEIASLVDQGTLGPAASDGVLFSRSDNTKLWPHDIVGIADLLELRGGTLRSVLGASNFHQLVASLRQSEAQFLELDDSLCKFKRRGDVQSSLAGSIRMLGTASIPIETFPGPVWGVLAELALIMDDLRLYMHFRERGFKIEREKASGITSADSLTIPAWQAAVRTVSEADDKELLRELDECLPVGISAKDRLVSASAHLQLGDLHEFRARTEQHFSKKDRQFARFIKGKSVAICGPVDVVLQNGDEIDEFDLVLRFNFQGKPLDALKFGSRTDLSFYIDIDMPRNRPLDEAKLAAINSLQYAVVDFTHADTDPCFEGVTVPKRRRFKAGHIFCNHFFRGTHNAIPRSIADLLRFDIARVKIFNADMFASLNYQAGYRTSNGAMLLKTFVRHDPVSNFSFMQGMYRNGLIEVDQRLAEVLRMSSEQYVEVLHRRYGIDEPAKGLVEELEPADMEGIARPNLATRIWSSIFRG